MDKLVYTAATGMRARMAAQAAIANNMPSGGEAQLTLPGIGQIPVSDVVEVG